MIMLNGRSQINLQLLGKHIAKTAPIPKINPVAFATSLFFVLAFT
jgi:hypothetical protein